jgi:hypothetical protein
MLENLIDLIKKNAGSAITNNPAIPNDRNEEAVQEAGHSIMDTLKQAISGGNLKDVMKLFSGNQQHVDNNPVLQQASGDLAGRLQNKFGLDGEQAAGVADKLVPNVMSQLAQKTADSSDSSFNIQSIFNQLSGGKTSGVDVQGMVSKFKGKLDADGDGDVDLQDLKGLLGGGGSIMDKVKGLFN